MKLHLIVSTASCLYYDIDTVVNTAIQNGVTHVQLREKTLSTPDFLQIGTRLKEILKPQNIPLIINDRVDIALALDADGVHIGQNDLPYAEARRILDADKIIGLSITEFAQLQQANQYQLDYIGVGPIFTTNTKSDATPPMGITQLQKICQYSNHPVIAIGGINVNNVMEITKTECAGIAVSSAICAAQDPINCIQQLLCGKTAINIQIE